MRGEWNIRFLAHCFPQYAVSQICSFREPIIQLLKRVKMHYVGAIVSRDLYVQNVCRNTVYSAFFSFECRLILINRTAPLLAYGKSTARQGTRVFAAAWMGKGYEQWRCSINEPHISRYHGRFYRIRNCIWPVIAYINQWIIIYVWLRIISFYVMPYSMM